MTPVTKCCCPLPVFRDRYVIRGPRMPQRMSSRCVLPVLTVTFGDKIAALRRAAQPLLGHCAQMGRYNLEWRRRDTLASA